MIALIASLMLGLYILLPVFIFEQALAFFVPVKRITRTRTEEVAFGAAVILVPLLLAFLLCHWSYWIGHHPFPLNENADRTKGMDYKVVITALQSDHYFETNNSQVWLALEHIELRQTRFLFWMYLILTVECALAIVLIRNYGAWRHRGFYRWISSPLFKRVSPWHILFTTYAFPPGLDRHVHLDVVLHSGELFTGLIGPENYMTNPDGSLCALLLTQTRRFKRNQLEEDRKKNISKPTAEYWSVIAGDGQFFIPAEAVSNINIRFRVSEEILKTELREQLAKVMSDADLDAFEITLSRPQFDILAEADASGRTDTSSEALHEKDGSTKPLDIDFLKNGNGKQQH